MLTKLLHVSVPVGDYDEALKWYTEKLGLEVRKDNTFGEGFRFLTGHIGSWQGHGLGFWHRQLPSTSGDIKRAGCANFK